ncbi:glycosyltransferase family 4 protein [Lacimicrobium sp. SS2-24]|uniref:glycosyltransferase family 4 protein n=1 Tax=Lacimicrobium sp. SS2-24 TaxID=2005569 RepID=UPI000B4BDEF6|nr:glycosyltransferase family 4 protein [Lacimicrobium sp. SS2-24]
MTVLHLLKTAIGAKWALNQIKELIKRGVDVHVAMPDGPMNAGYEALGVTVHKMQPEFSFSHPLKTMTRARALHQLVDELKPDLIHSHFVSTTLLMRLALRKTRIPRIFQVPGPLHLEHALLRGLEIASSNKEDYWLASCKWTQQRYIKSGVAAKRTGLAYYGVPPGVFTAPEPGSFRLKQQLKMQEEDLLIGMVAYFYAPKRFLGQTRGLKGHEDLIDALALVLKQYPTARCVFVGGPWDNALSYYDQVQAYASEKVGDAAVFLGTRTDVPQLYPQFDLAVHPSHSENVGGAVESLFAGVSTITSDVGGFPDLIIEGETGYLCPPKDPQALAAAICRAWQNPAERQKRIVAGLKQVTELMDIEHNARQVMTFYEHVLNTYSGSLK